MINILKITQKHNNVNIIYIYIYIIEWSDVTNLKLTKFVTYHNKEKS